MGKKTISNTFTVNTVEDGESAPYYFQEWFAWSNDSTTASVTTAPTIAGSWATSIPAQGAYAYLWRKSIRYVWNESTRQYSSEAAQYFRMSGTDGTSIHTRGQVANASSRGNGTATVITDSGTRTITLSDGDAVTQLDNGHLYQWVTEGGGKWLDLGQFKGESGKTYYTHIAWATNVNYNSSGVVTRVDGFTIDKSPNDTTHLWMGVLVNEDSSTDSSDALDYTWSYTKGVDGFSVQAQYAPNNNPSSSQIHNTWQNGDIYMRTKQSNETNWSSWNKIVGESGGETDYQFAISANKVSQDGTSATAPTDILSSDWQDTPLIVTTAKPYLWSKVQKKDGNGNNVGNPSYMRLTGEESIDYSVEGALNTIKVGAGQTTTMVNCTYTFYQKPAVSSTRSTVSCYYAVYLRSGNTFSLLTMSTGYNNHGSGTSVTVNSNVPYKSGSVVYNAVVIYIFPSSYYSTSPEIQNYMAKKEIPIVKDGDTAFVVDLENEMTNVALDEDGKLTSALDMYFKVRAYYGTTNVLSDSACLVSASCSDSDVTLSTTYAKTTGIRVQISDGTAMADTTEISVTVTHTTYGTRTVIFTLAGVRGGENAVLQELLPSLDAISFARTAAGGLTPSSRDLTLSIKKTQGGSTSTQSISDSGLTIRWSSTSMPASKTGGNGWGNGTATGIYWNNTTMQIANTVAATNIYIAAFNSAGTLVDRETIPVIKDGKKGDKGDDALTLALDTYAIAFPTDSDYNVESQKTYIVGARMYLGNSTQRTITSLTASLDVADGDIDLTQTSPANGVVITLGESRFSYDIGVNVTAVCDKGTRTAKIILTAAPQGEEGTRGNIGRFFYFGGTFDSSDTTQTFIVNDAQAPYFEHTETITTQSGTTTIKRYHVFNYETNGSYTMAQMWAISSNWNSKPWEVMTNDFKYIITEAIFGAYAHFGANIINGDYRLSQYGYMRGFYDSKVSVNSGTQYIYFDDSDPFGYKDMFSKTENMVANQSLSDYEIPDSTHYVILGNNIEFAPSSSPESYQIENTFTSSCNSYRFKTNDGWDSWYTFSSGRYYFALSESGVSAPTSGWSYSKLAQNLVPTASKPYLWARFGTSGTPFLASSPQKSFTIEKGRYYAISIETENYDAGNFNIRIGTKNSHIDITSGSLKKELIGDALTYYGIFISDRNSTKANLWTNKSGLSFTFEAVYKAQFVPMLCEDLKSGKLVANNIVARGELHADGLYYSMYNEKSNNGTIPVEDKSIVSIGTTGVGSVVKLPSPSASKGRKVEVYNYATSWKATWDGATSTSTFSCPYGSGLDYRTVDATSKKYVLFYCDGSTWWILRAEN